MSRSHHFHCHPEASSSESKIILIITLPYPVPGPPPLLCAILVALSRYPKYSEAAIEQTVAAFSAILTITKPSKISSIILSRNSLCSYERESFKALYLESLFFMSRAAEWYPRVSILWVTWTFTAGATSLYLALISWYLSSALAVFQQPTQSSALLNFSFLQFHGLSLPILPCVVLHHGVCFLHFQFIRLVKYFSSVFLISALICDSLGSASIV